MPETPPDALTQVVAEVEQRLHLRLGLLPAAQPHSWSVLEYAPDGTAHLLIAATEEGALYRVLSDLLERGLAAGEEPPHA